MRRPSIRLITLLIASFIWPTVYGHHSVNGQFDVAKTVTLAGTIARVEWINPHAYVHLNVPGNRGTTTTWALSTIPIAMLRKAGLTKAALTGRQGETVRVLIHPGYNGRPIGWIIRITYADGHYYSLFE